MGLAETLSGSIGERLANASTGVLIASGLSSLILLTVVFNVLQQILFKNPHEPPLVFHWVPFIGSTVAYGPDPYKFFFKCREKYGDVFTFILLGKNITVFLGKAGNEFILNAKHKDVNAEDIYSPLCTPVFGKGVVYDCPNSKLMEQKKFVKFGLTTEAMRAHVHLITKEVRDFVSQPQYKLDKTKGKVDMPGLMSTLTLFTAARSLQGKEVRSRLDSSFAGLYHDLDKGFSPLNFMLHWAPLPWNHRRDVAQQTMEGVYSDIIAERKAAEKAGQPRNDHDMLWNLMQCRYRDGTVPPDSEIAGMMIALLMAGQHSSSSTITWCLLNLALRPDIQDELLEEQYRVLANGDKSKPLPELTYDDLANLPLHAQVVKETLRIHSPIHSILRRVTNPMPIDGTPYVIPRGNSVLASPGVTARSKEFFPEPLHWEPHRWDANVPVDSSLAALRPRDAAAVAADEGDDEKVDYGYGMVSKGTNSPYLPFGAGRHRCIGEQFAYLQLQTILVEMTRQFRFKADSIVQTDYTSLFSQPMRPALVEYVRR